MITKRQFLELIQDRLVGGPAKADERKNYPLPMIARMVDIVLPTFLQKFPEAINDMAVTYEYEVPQGTTSVTLSALPIMGVYSFGYAGDSNGQVEVRDIVVNKALSRLNPSQKRVVVVGNGRTAYIHFTPVGKLQLMYVPRVSDMSDNDQIDLSGEGEIFNLLCQMIRANEKFLNDKTNNDLVDPQ